MGLKNWNLTELELGVEQNTVSKPGQVLGSGGFPIPAWNDPESTFKI